ncbi:phosphatidylinositol/phosphatidylcholine transfer protein SFH11 [Spinacia oleracea]|uniref:Phosphatidylinositol/phosphatidylcholine transfer protein SFH11 n=1 Tax=Spinacia oleracea TaxID=3562 RepID=A0ABM3QWU7_SPIOL|nr:phosphatidylinositol/phosphatidylcholine transfer protein SFH11 [Spinacia oleracea]
MSSPLKLLHKLGKRVWRSKGNIIIEEEEDHNIDHNNDDDNQAVKMLRESLLQDQVGDDPNDDRHDFHTLLRFLHMRDYDIMKAKDSFIKHLKWREEFGVDAIAKEFKFVEFRDVQRFYPHGFHGRDRSGNPVYIERLGMIDLDGLLQVTTMERLVKHHVYEQEKTSRLRYPACTVAAGKKKKRIGTTTVVVDVKGLGTSSFSKQARYLFLEFQKIDSNYYPDTLNCLFIVNG